MPQGPYDYAADASTGTTGMAEQLVRAVLKTLV
jgi:hypothetical protein